MMFYKVNLLKELHMLWLQLEGFMHCIIVRKNGISAPIIVMGPSTTLLSFWTTGEDLIFHSESSFWYDSVIWQGF